VLRATRRLELATSSRFAGPNEKSESVLREMTPIYRLFLVRELQRDVNLSDLQGTRWSAIFGMHGTESLTCELVIGDKGVRYLQWRKLGVGDCHVPGGELSLLLPLPQEGAPPEEKDSLEIRVRETELFGKNPTWESYPFKLQSDHEFSINIPSVNKKDNIQTWKFNRVLRDSKEMYKALRTLAESEAISSDRLSSAFSYIRWVHHRAELMERIVVKERDAFTSIGRLFAQLRMARDKLQQEKIKKQISEIWCNPADPDTLRNFKVGDSAGKKETLGYMLKNYNEAIERDPHWPEVWYKRAQAHYERAWYNYSLFDLIQVLRREPRHFGALNLLQDINKQKGNMQEELDALRLLLQIMPHARKYKERRDELETELNEAGGEELPVVPEQEEPKRMMSLRGQLKSLSSARLKSLADRISGRIEHSKKNTDMVDTGDTTSEEEGYPKTKQNIELADTELPQTEESNRKK